MVDPEWRLDGERHFDQLKVALDAQRPDITHLCTPTETHAALALECLAAATHVICEKPLAARAEEARFVAATSGADGYSREERSRILHEILPHTLSLFAFLFGNDSLDA